jgi:hypothetical protein
VTAKLAVQDKRTRLYRIKGTKGRIDWLKNLRNNSKKGGEAHRAKWEAKREPIGSDLASQLAEPDESPLSLALALALAPNNIYSPDTSIPKKKQTFDFEPLYQKYPRRERKKRGMQNCRTRIKTQQDYENLSRSIDRYVEFCVKEKREQRYIQLWSTFVNSYEDWLEEDAGMLKLPNQNDTLDMLRNKFPDYSQKENEEQP